MYKFAAAGALAALLTLTAAAPAAAEPFSAESARSRTITVPRNKSLSFRLDTPASKIVVAQPETAQIVATTDRSFYVRGKELGATNLLVYGAGGQLMEVIDIRVGYDAEALKADLSAALPGETIQVGNLGEGLLLSGEVSNTAAAARALSLAERIAPKAVTSALTVRASQQVVLEVRVLEASREALREFGINIDAGGSRFALQTGSGLLSGSAPSGLLAVRGTIGQSYVDVVLQALEEKNVIRTLAKPNLVALSGAKASFLAGGEFPFPIPADEDTLAIDFREYGVKLDFEPTVQDNGLIRLHVAPEVSQLDPRGGIQVMGVQIPGLTSRKTETTVELRDGESLAIAGLFQEDYVNAVRDLPGVGEVPVLGALFRSSRWRRQETELVIIVTPRLATAGDLSPDKPATLGGDEKSMVDLILTGKALDKPLASGRKGRR
jgi:pilus assembly protein CpaC